MRFQFPIKYYPYLILLLSVFFYLPIFSQVHLFDWDEINFAESAREMILTKNYSVVQIDFIPFYEKPPFFFWMQAAAMHVFGISEFAARFPNAVIGSITLLVLFFIGKKIKNAVFGLLWALMYWGSLTPHLYFKSGIIDPTFNLFIFLGIFWMINAKDNPWNALWSGLSIGLAVLTKGPVAGLIWALTLFFYWMIYSKFKPIVSSRQLLIFFISCFTISSIWIFIQLKVNGIGFLQEFVDYQVRLFTTSEAGHGEPFYYHFVVVLLGCFPMSIFCIPHLLKREENENSRWMKTLFWVVMILFSISTTKIVHYSSLAYFPVSFLAATFLIDWLENKTSFPLWLRKIFLSIGILLGIAVTSIPLIGMNASKIISWIHEVFVAKNLEAQVHWTGFEIAIGLFYLLIVIGIGVYFNSIIVNRMNKKIFIGTITTSTAVLLLLASFYIVPKIERYTQGAAIDFYKSKSMEDAYVDVIGFKSYAQYFYFKKPYDVNSKIHNLEWLLNGKVDKPVYLVCKVDRMEEYRKNPNLEVLYEQNGFVFLKRKIE